MRIINDVLINDHERVDDLHRNGYKIIQSPENFCFGCDAVLLSAFATIKPFEHALDLGTGTGIIPILLEAKTKGEKFYGLEIQKEMVEMSRRSVQLNNLSSKIEIIEGNIKDLATIFKPSQFDVITTNPPYMNSGAGLINDFDNKAIARHEILCNLEDIILGSAKCLKTNGRFYMIHRPHRLVDIIYYLRNYNLEPKKIRFVHPKFHKEPSMVLIEAIKNAKPMLKTLPPLIMYKDDGTYTDEINDIYYKD